MAGMKVFERTKVERLPNRRAKYQKEMIVSIYEIKILDFEKSIYLTQSN